MSTLGLMMVMMVVMIGWIAFVSNVNGAFSILLDSSRDECESGGGGRSERMRGSEGGETSAVVIPDA